MAGTFFDGAQGGKYHLEEYEGKKPGFYEVEGGKIKVDKDGKVTFYKSGPVPKSFSDTYTEEPETPETPETRTSPVTGIVQTGKKLGIGDINGLFASLNERGQMTAGDLPSAGTFFSEALATTPQAAYQGGELNIETEKDTGYELGTTLQTGGSRGKTLTEKETAIKGGSGYKISPKSMPGALGGNPANPEDGTSDKPDVADQIRQVRMHRNKRDQLEGFSDDEPFGGVDTTKGNGMTASRRAARAAFLDEGNKGYAAIRARDRAVGAFHQYDKGGMKIGDDIHMFKDGMSKDARFELSGNGIDSKEAAQSFLNKYVQGFGEAAPTDSPTEPPASEQTATTLTPRNPSTAEKPSDPVIVDSTAPHPDTGRKPDAATEQSNKEYAATQFRFDPDKNMMVPVK